VFLKEYKPGEAFGELALLYNAPRAATIIAKVDSQVWSLDRCTFTHILKHAMFKRREKIDAFLGDLKVIKQIKNLDKSKLADAIKDQWYEKGDTIMTEDDMTGDQWFVVMEGEAYAMRAL
jgi:cAMP-dependent protein kinase regulator